ncbi:MAG: FAD:protein FMN transferase, partial [Planctomycetota bacterium]
MNRRIARAIAVLVCLSLAGVSVSSCAGKGQVDADSGHQLVMGTFAHVVVVADDSTTAKKCIKAALEEIRRVDELMSDYKRDSEISRLNAEAAGRAVQVGESTYEVLQRSVAFSRLTG